jgi:hypothetical protein
MSQSYRALNPYHWLGQPATAQNTIPASAGRECIGSRVRRVFLFNGSASTVAACLAGLFPDSAWSFGAWVDGTTTLTDDTADAQSAATNDAAINTTTINDGHIIGCDYPFGLISYDMTTATVGAALAGVLEYWNGSAWTGLVAAQMLVDIPRAAGVQWALGELIVMFDPPADWAKGGSGTGVNANRYNLRYRSSAAGSTAGLARRIYVGVPITVFGAITTKAEGTRQYTEDGIEIPQGVVRIGCAANLAVGTVSTVVGSGLEFVF